LPKFLTLIIPFFLQLNIADAQLSPAPTDKSGEVDFFAEHSSPQLPRAATASMSETIRPNSSFSDACFIQRRESVDAATDEPQNNSARRGRAFVFMFFFLDDESF
jgi:hypothetical protein